MSQNEIELIAYHWMILSGIAFYIFYVPIRLFLRKRSLQRIKNKLTEGEHIIYEPKLSWFNELILPLTAGCNIGGYILPFFVFKNITHIGKISREFLPLVIISEIVFVFIVLLIGCIKIAITNTRIINAYPYVIMTRFLRQNINISFSDIDYLEILNLHYCKVLVFRLKDDSNYKINYFRNMQKTKDVIDKQLNSNGRV